LRRLDGLWFQLPLLMAVHAKLWPALFEGASLRPSDYFSRTLFDKALSLAQLGWPLLTSTAVIGLSARHLSWRKLDPGCRTRAFILIVAGLFAWVYSTFDINFYLDQTHLVDRLLLLSLWALAWIHPIIVPLFVAQSLVLAIQLHFPLPEGDWMWPDKRLPIDTLILFNGFLLIKGIAGPLRVRLHPLLFPIATLCVTGASYVHAGVNKARLGPHWWSWIVDNEISNLLVSAHLQANWLGDWSHETVLRWSQLLSIANPLLGGFSFCAELSAIALLLNWKATRAILIALIAMHIGIVLTSGIFFWKWIVFDATLLAYIHYLRRDARRQEPAGVDAPPFELFGWGQAIIGAIMIVAGPLYARLVPLAWMDTEYVNFSRYVGVTAGGERYTIDPYFFAPYDVLFTQSRFFYLDRSSTLVGTYGVSPSYSLAQALNDVSSMDRLARLRRVAAGRYYDRARAETFAGFVRRFTNAAQARHGTPSWLRRLAPPYHFQRQPFHDAYAFQSELVKVEVIAYEYFHQDGRLYELASRLIASIDLTPPASQPESIRVTAGDDDARGP
jgi:hypothetical protein